MSGEMVCNYCPTDNVLVLDVDHHERGYDFDRYVCPSCKTSFTESTAIAVQTTP